MLNRRQFVAAGLGTAGAVVSGAGLALQVWPLLAREDLIPGDATEIHLIPHAWTTAEDEVSFVAIGDNGSGGRQAMAVAERIARTYSVHPFGLVVLLGDICYYGNIADRFNHVFQRPMRPLIDAGVRFELAIGNHDSAIRRSDEGLDEIEAELRLLGTPGLYYEARHGPVDLFCLDSSVPGLLGSESRDQLEWLDEALARSSNQWKIVALHHPPYSSGRHGSTYAAQELLVPILVRRQVDLVLSGHDHDYERSHPLDGITYVVSGGGCKRTPVGRQSFTAVAQSILEFLFVHVRGDRMVVSCIQPDGRVADEFELRARARG
ncbi:MAG TPA: metallophosphoesterase [Acidimicrobiales bacterium]|jgi:3',5'-cyclic AMP phosphodiesterase CpdA|nr:metallophosphoesterase [Acidimicrobiales bacterium]